METINNLVLQQLLFQCSHALHRTKKYRGRGRLLILLLQNGTMTQRELIEITARRSATLSEQLENMESAGYITRKKNESDKRNVDITLTPLGEEVAKDVYAFHIKLAQDLFEDFTENEKQQLFQLMDKLLNNLKNITAENEE